MSDYDIKIKSNKGIIAEFEPQKTLTLKNQPVDKTKLTELNDLVTANNDTRQNGDVLVYDKENDNFVYTSGALIRDANSEYVVIGDRIVPALGRTDVDLGTRTRPFRSLYVQGETITLGNVALKDSGTGTLAVGTVDLSGNVTFTGDVSVISTANLMTLGTDVGNTPYNFNDGALQVFEANTTVVNSIDFLNEALLNVFQNSFVRNVTFTGSPLESGVGTTVTLDISVEGNPNQYDIDWGDGNYSNGVTNTTPSHVYTDNTNTPFTVTVTAKNTTGAGAGSSATFTRVDYITIYAADPEPTFEIYSVLTGGTSITEANTGQTVYLQNNTRNIPNTDITATYSINWGDGGAVETIDGKTDAGGDQGSRLSHVYTSDSGSGLFTLTMNVESMSSATPGIFPISNTVNLKVFDINIGAPDNITNKTVGWGTSSVGSTPALCVGFSANADASGKSSGDSISSTFPRFITGTVSTSAMSTYFHTTGSVTALINETANTINATTNESNVDYYNLNASGSSVSALNRIYAPNLYETGTKSTISFDVTSFEYGVNKIEFVTDEGNSNELYYVYDSLTINPTIDVSSASIAEDTVSYNYISGVPYYDSGDTLTVSGIVVNNLTGQTYYDASDAIRITASNAGGTIGTGVATQSYNYSTALNASDRSSNVPNANLTSVDIEDLSVPISTGDRIVRLNFNVENVNGTSAQTISDTRIQVFNGVDVIDESAIAVEDGLGINYTTDAVRVSGFTGANPAFSPTTDYYVDNAWSEPVTVEGTDESIIRYGEVQHFTDDLSTGFLPVGPDLATGRSGTQYFRLAFKRSAVSNIRVRLSGKVSGFYIAVPGTAIDDASSINGWLDASIQYAGSGVPGGDTGSGGNGSNGCAFTGADRILDGVTYSNQTFDLTLGTESTTNSFENQVLVTIALNSDDSITSLSFEDTD